jgi:hypothetical protein
VRPEDGRLTPETSLRFKTLQSDRESESVLRWLRYCGDVIVLYGNFVADKLFMNYNSSLCKQHRANTSFSVFYPVQ